MAVVFLRVSLFSPSASIEYDVAADSFKGACPTGYRASVSKFTLFIQSIVEITVF